MKCPQAHQSVRNQPRMIGPSSATVIHAQPDPAHPGNDPQPADPSTFRSLASTRAGGRRQHRSHEPPPSHEKEPALYTIASTPGDSSTCASGSTTTRPGTGPGAGDPTGCSSGTIKVAKDIPVGRPSNCDGAVLYCNPAADTEGRVILPDRSPEHPKQHPHAAAGWAVVETPPPDAVDRGCHRHRHRRW